MRPGDREVSRRGDISRRWARGRLLLCADSSVELLIDIELLTYKMEGA